MPEFIYANTVKNSICVHCAAGETFGTLGDADAGVPTCDFIKVDGGDENYKLLLEQDPFLESVVDPTQPREGEVPTSMAKQMREAREAAAAAEAAAAEQPVEASSGPMQMQPAQGYQPPPAA